MKQNILILLATATAALAQGPLTPPGAPAPTMKTLDQVEARTPIETLPYTISASGSYYFTKNLQFTATSGNAITITTGNVTLDLNGFTLSSTSGVTGRAILVNNDLNNIAIKNGNIVGNTTVTVSGTGPNQTWSSSLAGFDRGIYAFATVSRNMTVDQIQVSGCRNNGIFAAYGIVANSTAYSNGGDGILASFGNVTNSSARSNGGDGISTSSGSVTNSTASYNRDDGISASSGSVANSTVRFNGRGIFATYGSVMNSKASSNGGNGINASDGSVTNCVATSNNTSGGTAFDLYATNAVIAFTKYGTGTTTGSTLTGNKTP